MSKSFLPSISADLLQAADSHWSYLNLILEAYQKGLAEDERLQDAMSVHQHGLMAYSAFHSHVSVGGFLQLIQNGFGGYLFDNPFSQVFGSWGALSTQSLMDRARPLYLAKRAELERETTLEEFAKMYEAYPEFDALDQEYLTVMEQEAAVVRNFVEAHLSEFVQAGA